MDTNDGTSLGFFLSVVAAYLTACGAWLLLRRVRPQLWPAHRVLETSRPWLDFGLVFVAVACILGLGQAWRAEYLLPEPAGWHGDLLWNLNNLIIYSPLFIVLAARRQSPATIYLSADGVGVKLATGLVFGIGTVIVYTLLRGDPQRLSAVAWQAVHRDSLRHFVPVFLEGVALAFAFVRLRRVVGHVAALLLPAIIFALAHVPRQLESGTPLPEMMAYFAVTGVVTVAVLHVLERSQDILWLGVVHYLMDVAIGAFD